MSPYGNGFLTSQTVDQFYPGNVHPVNQMPTVDQPQIPAHCFSGNSTYQPYPLGNHLVNSFFNYTPMPNQLPYYYQWAPQTQTSGYNLVVNSNRSQQGMNANATPIVNQLAQPNTASSTNSPSENDWGTVGKGPTAVPDN